MNNIQKIVLLHYNKYHAIQLEDFFKLAYQNEFGSKHLLINEEEFLERLEQEKTIHHKSMDIEDIGNNMIRVDISLIKDTNLFLKYVKKCCESSKTDNIRFLEKLEDIKKIIEKKNIPISLKNFSELKEEFVKSSFLPISHSPLFKKEYDPHYRVISKKMWKKYLREIS